MWRGACIKDLRTSRVLKEEFEEGMKLGFSAGRLSFSDDLRQINAKFCHQGRQELGGRN